MTVTALLALFLASALNAALPGPCLLLTMNRAAAAGWRAGLAVALGIVAARGLLLALAGAVIAGLLTLRAPMLDGMKWAGIVVLVLLALRVLRRAAPLPCTPLACDRARPAGGDGLAGFALAFSSPYNLVFYLALLPQVLPPAPLSATAMATAGLAILAGGLAVQFGTVLLALGCARAGRRAGRWAERLSAACLLLFAAAAVTEPSGGAGVEAHPPGCQYRISAR